VEKTVQFWFRYNQDGRRGVNHRAMETQRTRKGRDGVDIEQEATEITEPQAS
jgi:hypothetical protein